MTVDQNVVVRVHVAWNGWQYADVPLAILKDVHWYHPVGAARPLVHAYVPSEVFGAVASFGVRMASRLHVCVLKGHALASAYQALVRYADQHQQQMSHDAGRCHPRESTSSVTGIAAHVAESGDIVETRSRDSGVTG